MDDRTLLERAARAAGVPAYWSDDGTLQKRPVLVVKAGGGMGTMPYEAEWNPLRDDDTALRLAVKLKIDLRFPRDNDMYVDAGDCDGYTVYLIDTGNDRGAATRRAIVRAAASLAEGEAN